MKIKLYTLILFGLILIQYSCQKSPWLKADKQIGGQSAPPDMVFIEGNGNIPSFFISRSEETNINYLVYLEWLKRVYVDYPEVFTYALPGQHYQSEDAKFNDPYFNNYLNHPSYSYYPVQGVSWDQIQDYCIWKTDRLNEAILAETKITKGIQSRFQLNEENFNTETYLEGQYYDPKRGKNSLNSKNPKGKRRVSLTDGILFTGYRLPTEAEWDYVCNNPKYNHPLTKNKFQNNYPYGKNYFIFHWVEMYKNSSYNNDRDENEIFKDYQYFWKKNKLKVKEGKRLYGPGSYNAEKNSVLHLTDNVSEWLLDYYTDSSSYTGQNYLKYLSENGFHLAPEDAYLDSYGIVDEKDSLGRFPFRMLSVKSTGEPMWFLHHYTKKYYRRSYQSVKSYYKDGMHPKAYQNFERSLTRNWDSIYNHLYQISRTNIDDLIKSNSNNINYYGYNDLIRFYKMKDTASYNLAVDRRILPGINQQKNHYFIRGYWFSIETNRWVTMDKNGPYEIRNQIKPVPNELDYKDLPRLIKGGDWNNQGHQKRDSLRSHHSRENVGFRTVIEYQGIPVKKQYKVTWK